MADEMLADVEARLDRARDVLAVEYARSAPLNAVGGGGALRSALITERQPRRLTLAVDDTIAPHGKWIDDPPAEVRPKRAKALSWVDPISGDAVFATRVVPSRKHAGWWSVRFRATVDGTVREVFTTGFGRLARG